MKKFLVFTALFALLFASCSDLNNKSSEKDTLTFKMVDEGLYSEAERKLTPFSVADVISEVPEWTFNFKSKNNSFSLTSEANGTASVQLSVFEFGYYDIEVTGKTTAIVNKLVESPEETSDGSYFEESEVEITLTGNLKNFLINKSMEITVPVTYKKSAQGKGAFEITVLADDDLHFQLLDGKSYEYLENRFKAYLIPLGKSDEKIEIENVGPNPYHEDWQFEKIFITNSDSQECTIPAGDYYLRLDYYKNNTDYITLLFNEDNLINISDGIKTTGTLTANYIQSVTGLFDTYYTRFDKAYVTGNGRYRTNPAYVYDVIDKIIDTLSRDESLTGEESEAYYKYFKIYCPDFELDYARYLKYFDSFDSLGLCALEITIISSDGETVFQRYFNTFESIFEKKFKTTALNAFCSDSNLTSKVISLDKNSDLTILHLRDGISVYYEANPDWIRHPISLFIDNNDVNISDYIYSASEYTADKIPAISSNLSILEFVPYLKQSDGTYVKTSMFTVNMVTESQEIEGLNPLNTYHYYLAPQGNSINLYHKENYLLVPVYESQIEEFKEDPESYIAENIYLYGDDDADDDDRFKTMEIPFRSENLHFIPLIVETNKKQQRVYSFADESTFASSKWVLNQECEAENLGTLIVNPVNSNFKRSDYNLMELNAVLQDGYRISENILFIFYAENPNQILYSAYNKGQKVNDGKNHYLRTFEYWSQNTIPFTMADDTDLLEHGDDNTYRVWNINDVTFVELDPGQTWIKLYALRQTPDGFFYSTHKYNNVVSEFNRLNEYGNAYNHVFLDMAYDKVTENFIAISHYVEDEDDDSYDIFVFTKDYSSCSKFIENETSYYQIPNQEGKLYWANAEPVLAVYNDKLFLASQYNLSSQVIYQYELSYYYDRSGELQCNVSYVSEAYLNPGNMYYKYPYISDMEVIDSNGKARLYYLAKIQTPSLTTDKVNHNYDSNTYTYQNSFKSFGYLGSLPIGDKFSNDATYKYYGYLANNTDIINDGETKYVFVNPNPNSGNLSNCFYGPYNFFGFRNEKLLISDAGLYIKNGNSYGKYNVTNRIMSFDVNTEDLGIYSDKFRMGVNITIPTDSDYSDHSLNF